MKSVAIFDLDGTLLNTLESISYCGNTILKHFSCEPLDSNTYVSFIGNGAPVLLKKLYDYVKVTSTDFDRFLEYGLSVYAKHGCENILPYNGIECMLKYLKAKGIKCAVLSNKPHNLTVEICKEHFPDTFELVYGHREDVPKKPDPYMIKHILNQLNCKEENCIYCGDSSVDVETAKNAGIMILGAAWGFYGKAPFENADAILEVPQDIFKYI